MSNKDFAVETLIRLWVYQEEFKRIASWRNLRPEIRDGAKKTEESPSEKEAVLR